MRDKSGDRRGFTFQGHWLGQVSGSDSFYACWYDPAKGRSVQRRSLRESDAGRAEVALVNFVLAKTAPPMRDPNAVEVCELVLRYLNKTDSQPCGPGYRSMSVYIAEWWGATLVSEMTQAKQRQFIKWLGEKGHSTGYVKKIVGIISGAMGYAVENDMLLVRPSVLMARGKIAEMVNKPVRNPIRRLDIPELAKLLDTVEMPHLFRYMMIAYNTLARPTAILELTKDRVTDGLISLNPVDRRQTKKHRPTIRLTDTLASWIKAWDADPNPLLIHFHGKAIEETRMGIQDVAIRAGLMAWEDKGTPRSIHPYTIRRSMARILRGRGVSMEDLGAWMGHRIPGAETTEVFYADAAPEYLLPVMAAIDGVMDEIGALMTRTPIRPKPVDDSSYRYGSVRLYGSF